MRQDFWTMAHNLGYGFSDANALAVLKKNGYLIQRGVSFRLDIQRRFQPLLQNALIGEEIALPFRFLGRWEVFCGRVMEVAYLKGGTLYTIMPTPGGIRLVMVGDLTRGKTYLWFPDTGPCGELNHS